MMEFPSINTFRKNLYLSVNYYGAVMLLSWRPRKVHDAPIRCERVYVFANITKSIKKGNPVFRVVSIKAHFDLFRSGFIL